MEAVQQDNGPRRGKRCCAPAGGPAKDEAERLVLGFKAVADPTRLRILQLIAGESGPLCVCHIVDRFDLGQPTISHHLRVLREAGLVSASKRGLWVYYAVVSDQVEALRQSLARLT